MIKDKLRDYLSAEVLAIGSEEHRRLYLIRRHRRSDNTWVIADSQGYEAVVKRFDTWFCMVSRDVDFRLIYLSSEIDEVLVDLIDEYEMLEQREND